MGTINEARLQHQCLVLICQSGTYRGDQYAMNEIQPKSTSNQTDNHSASRTFAEAHIEHKSLVKREHDEAGCRDNEMQRRRYGDLAAVRHRATEKHEKML